MTTWSSTDNGLQVGVDLSTSDATPFYGESITITCKWYVKSANRWNDNQTLNWSFDGSSGSKSFTNTVDGSSQLVLTKTTVVTANNSSHSRTGHGDITGAYNGATPSVTDSITIPAVSGAPDKPTGLSTSGLTSNALTLSWSASATNGSPVQSYTVAYGVTGSGNWTYKSTGGPSLSLALTGLTPNTSYDLKVKANSAAGSSAYSGVLLRTTAISNPSNPTSVSLNDTSTASVFQVGMSWTKGATNGSTMNTWDVLVSKYTNAGSPYATTTTGALSTSGTTTSIPVSALPRALSTGDTITTIDSTRSNAQIWTLTAGALSGATSVTVSATANFAYPSGSVVLLGSAVISRSSSPSPNVAAAASTTYYGWVRVASFNPSYVGGWVSGGSVVTGASGGQGDLVDRINALATQIGTDMAFVDANTGAFSTTFSVSGLAVGAGTNLSVSFPSTLRGTPKYVGCMLGAPVSGDTGLICQGTSGYSSTGFTLRVYNATSSSITASNVNLHVMWLV